jgi:hypothetical protein
MAELSPPQRCKSIRDALTGQNAAASAAHLELCRPETLKACSNVHAQDMSPGSADPPLLKESRDFLSNSLMRAFCGTNAWMPDRQVALGTLAGNAACA